MEDNLEYYPLADAIDHEILMHRDAHFGGKFSEMLDYYRQEGKGVQAEFELERIEKLAALEAQIGENLAALYLTGFEAERVKEAKEAYKKLRAIYEVVRPQSRIPQLIADLILTEDEEARVEIQAIVAEKEKIVPALINLLHNEHLYDPLFPGYGQAASLVVKCLGLIGDKRAIISLFEAFGKGDFFADDQILKALKEIGELAKQFLLKVVAKRPLNEDNEKAAIALIQFREEEEVAKICFQLLQDVDVQEDPCLPTYLVLACEGLKTMEDRHRFIALFQEKCFFRPVLEDMQGIIHVWEEGLKESS